jgi:hypothetical protein
VSWSWARRGAEQLAPRRCQGRESRCRVRNRDPVNVIGMTDAILTARSAGSALIAHGHGGASTTANPLERVKSPAGWRRVRSVRGPAHDHDPLRRPGVHGHRPRSRGAGDKRLAIRREAALIRAVLDELDYSAEEAIHTAHDLLGVAREVRRLAEVDLPGPQRTKSDTRASAARRSTGRSAAGLRTVRRSAREASQEGKRRLEATRAASRASVWPEPLGTPESVGGRASPSNGSTSI